MDYLLYKTNHDRYLTLVNSSILHNCKFAFRLLKRQNKFDDQHSTVQSGLFNSMRDPTVGIRIEDDEEYSTFNTSFLSGDIPCQLIKYSRERREVGQDK